MKTRKNLQSETKNRFLSATVFIVLALIVSQFGAWTALAAPDATFTVNDSGDAADASPGNGTCATSGSKCTLRAAIQEANAFSGADVIAFDSNVAIVVIYSALPALNDATGGTTIRGRSNYVSIAGTLAGADVDGLTLASNNNQLEGLYIYGFDGNGVVIGGDNNIIGVDGDGVNDAAEHNVIGGNDAVGIKLTSTANNNRIAGNWIGLMISGAVNANGAGIQLGGSGNRVGVLGDGVSDDLEGNVISGNVAQGIEVIANNSVIAGNIIGANPAGTAKMANGGCGVCLTSVTGTLIGTNGDGVADALEGNLVSGNGENGIDLSLSDSNTISGNFIGVNKSGSAKLANTRNGIRLDGSSDNVIGVGTTTLARGEAPTVISSKGNLISGHFQYAGINIGTGGGNIVAGNYIGTDATGSIALGNGNGIDIESSPSNIIGTNGDGVDDALEGNLISGNNNGIAVGSCTQTVIAGNLIGVNAAGDSALGNSAVGVIVNGTFNRIGTNGDGVSDALERNVISANDESGIMLDTHESIVAGNVIGLNAAGSASLGNGAHGIWIRSHTNRIGSDNSDPLEGNVISGNSQNGVYISTNGYNNYIVGNWIGVGYQGVGVFGNVNYGVEISGVNDNTIIYNVIAYNNTGIRLAGGSVDLYHGNTFYGNSIFSSLGLGIDLGAGGVTDNDEDDDDIGPNDLQNFPTLSLAQFVDGILTVQGALQSHASQNFMIEFYLSGVCNYMYNDTPIYLGGMLVSTDVNGISVFSKDFTPGFIVPNGYAVLATARNNNYSTSEFSECIAVDGPKTLYLPLLVANLIP